MVKVVPLPRLHAQVDSALEGFHFGADNIQPHAPARQFAHFALRTEARAEQQFQQFLVARVGTFAQHTPADGRLANLFEVHAAAIVGQHQHDVAAFVPGL